MSEYMPVTSYVSFITSHRRATIIYSMPVTDDLSVIVTGVKPVISFLQPVICQL